MLSLLRVFCLFLLMGGAATAQIHEDLIAKRPAAPDGVLAEVLQRGELVVGVKIDYPLWSARRPDGVIEGLEVDLAKSLADRLEVALRLVPVAAVNRMDRVNQGQVDVVIATTGDTVERREKADFLQPNYYSSGVVVYGRTDLGVTEWEDLRGQRICLNRNAYYNRALEEEFGIEGAYFTGSREALMALNYQRCVGWAFDDTALQQHIRTHPSDRFAQLVNSPPELVIPWAIFVAKGQGEATLGTFVSDMIGEWHASGFLLDRQAFWGIPETGFLRAKHETWRSVDPNGRAVCARDPVSGARAEICLNSQAYATSNRPEPSGWQADLKTRTGIDLSVFSLTYDRERLWRGLLLTLALSGLAIVGSLVVGISFALLDGGLRKWGWFGRLLLIPQMVVIAVARMTPPILQLYILFFGLGAIMLEAPELAPGAFVVAVGVLSLYAGSSNAALLSHALAREVAAQPGRSVLVLLPRAITRSFDGLIAVCVNIVKAAGMASVIAVAELVSTVNLTVAEGGDATTLMNGLLVFYFVLVTLVIWIFKRARAGLLGSA